MCKRDIKKNVTCKLGDIKTREREIEKGVNQ